MRQRLLPLPFPPGKKAKTRGALFSLLPLSRRCSRRGVTFTCCLRQHTPIETMAAADVLLPSYSSRTIGARALVRAGVDETAFSVRIETLDRILSSAASHFSSLFSTRLLGCVQTRINCFAIKLANESKGPLKPADSKTPRLTSGLACVCLWDCVSHCLRYSHACCGKYTCAK